MSDTGVSYVRLRRFKTSTIISLNFPERLSFRSFHGKTGVKLLSLRVNLIYVVLGDSCCGSSPTFDCLVHLSNLFWTPS